MTKKVNKELIDRVLDMYNFGGTKADIAKETGLNSDQIKAIIATADLPNQFRKQHSVKVRKDLIKGLRKIQVNKNTWVYIKKGQNEEEVREKWLKIIKRRN